MHLKEWVAEIKNPIRTLSNLELLLDEQDVVIKRERRLIRLSFPKFVSAEDFRYAKSEFGAIEEYIELLRNRLYSALLIDGSFIQISLDVQRDNIIGHRYCYYPCPIRFENNELRVLNEEESIVDIIEDFLSRYSEDILLRTPFRFDFESRQRKPGEPHAHVHFNHPDCRCALSAPIYPSYFVKFIMRYFYPNLWKKYQTLELLDQEMSGYWLKDDEEQFLHLTAKKAQTLDVF